MAVTAQVTWRDPFAGRFLDAEVVRTDLVRASQQPLKPRLTLSNKDTAVHRPLLAFAVCLQFEYAIDYEGLSTAVHKLAALHPYLAGR